ncbi:MAG: Co2+/Mg2+ efflux protein ApaG [Alphaproteobacteria bacterium]
MSELLYSKKTREILITVLPEYLQEQSSPDDSHYVWAYHIRIENQGQQTVQLKSRYWRIIDAQGRVQEVKGAGVVGEQPVLRPGESFEYSSGTPLATASGFMSGAYDMQSVEGEQFSVEIPTFSLDSPHQPQQLN